MHARRSLGYWVYRAFSRLYPLAIRLAAATGNEKAKAWVAGRNDELWDQLLYSRSMMPGRVAWFHAASLGEFEQARPVIEAFRKAYPHWGVVLSFFSPSGYLIRRNYAEVDLVTYLPADTPENAPRFLDLLRPDLILMVKYEFWPFYLLEAHKRAIPVVSFSAIFRPSQVFFKPWGGFMRYVLGTISRIYTQDEASLKLLSRIGIKATVAGDTRFDRVAQIAQSANKLPIVEAFKAGQPMIVLGSAWPADLKVLLPALLNLPVELRPKLVVAPHELSTDHLSMLDTWPGFQSVRYSTTMPDDARNANLLIVDNMGMLSSIYRYADVAWVGGAFGSGLHNILEAAVYGIPVLFGGPAYKRFAEAKALIKSKGAFSCITVKEAEKVLQKLLSETEARLEAGKAAGKYCRQHLGATDAIMKALPALMQQG